VTGSFYSAPICALSLSVDYMVWNITKDDIRVLLMIVDGVEPIFK
jgi:hypothetical protein